MVSEGISVKAFLHPQNRRPLLLALIMAVITGSSLLPLFGAETKSKKSAAKSATAATPKAKKSSSASSETSTEKKDKASATPKSSPKAANEASPSKKTTPRQSSSPKKSQKGSSASKTSAKEGAETDSKSTESKKESTPSPQPPSERNGSKKEVPGQPAPPLPESNPAAKSEQNSAAAPERKSPGKDSTPAAEGASSEPTPVSLTASTVPPINTKLGEDMPDSPGKGKDRVAPNVSIAPEDLLGFDEQPPKVQQLIKAALELSKQKLTYSYGSADPANGGMDCSGAIHYLLKEQGFADVPRDASGQYVWARKAGKFFAVVSTKADSFEFGDLLPGDLLFWNGTYKIDRDPPVTHTMIYLGVQRHRAQHVMWGSSDGRTYDSRPRWGVSVFDFKMPRADKNVLNGAKADFLGYARIPGLRD